MVLESFLVSGNKKLWFKRTNVSKREKTYDFREQYKRVGTKLWV
jgi:hypothetical protein